MVVVLALVLELELFTRTTSLFQPKLVLNSSSGFTILVNAFNRDGCAEKLVRHYLACRPHQIRVAWNDVSKEIPPSLLNLARDSQGTVVIDKHSSPNITNRFLPLPFPTQAIFHTDDDLVYDCKLLWAAFYVWQDNSRRQVGFAPRLVTMEGYFWGTSHQSLTQGRANTVFITRGGFLDHRFHESFFHPSLEAVRDTVNIHTNGEDLMMSFVAAATAPDTAEPVPLLWNQDPSFGCCVDNVSDPVSAGRRSHAERVDVIRALAERLGFSLKTTDLANFHYFDNNAGRFLSFGERCGYQHILNPVWLYCAARIRLNSNWV